MTKLFSLLPQTQAGCICVTPHAHHCGVGAPEPGASAPPRPPAPAGTRRGDPPTVFFKLLGLVGAVEELPLEELHGHHGEDEHEEHVHDEDVENVLERVHHTVKHGLAGAERGSEGPEPLALASSGPEYRSGVTITQF